MAAEVLVTGASGLIGSQVTRHWDLPDYDLVAVEHRENDLLAPGVPSSLLERHRPSVVIHLAWAASGRVDYRTSPDNERWLAASLELKEACDRTGAWLIATGTSLDEVNPASDAYTSSKHRLRTLLNDHITDLTMTWLRPYYVIDASWRRPALVAEAIGARDAGEAIVLREPDSTHDFVVAADVGRAIVEVVRWGLRGEVAIGSGCSRRVRDVVAALGTRWVAAEISSPTRETPHNHEVADVARLQRCGWSPESTTSFFDRS